MRRALRIAGAASLALLFVLAIGLVAISAHLYWHFLYEIGIPDYRRVMDASTARVCTEDNPTFVPLAEIPATIRQAALAADDPHFYVRPRLNLPVDLVRFFLSNAKVSSSPWSGWLARCLVRQRPSFRVGLDWHVMIAIVTYRIERDIPKDAILEMFLNGAYFGRGSYGVSAAADAYFGKPLAELSMDESAFIAALTKAPSSLDKNLQRGIERRNAVLDRMTAARAITSEQAEAAKQMPLRFREAKAPN